MRKNSPFFLVLLCGLFACKQGKEAKSEGSGRDQSALRQRGAAKAGGTKSLLASINDQAVITPEDLAKLATDDLSLLENSRRVQSQSLTEELAVLGVLSDNLCKKVVEIRKTCPAQLRLVPDAATNSLRCQGTMVDSRTSPSRLSVTIPTNKAGNFVLIANDLWVSSIFSAGTTPISFTSKGAQSGSAPKLASLWKLVLRSAPGQDLNRLAPLPSLAGFSLKMTSGETIVLNTELRASQDQTLADRNLEYHVDTRKFAESNQDPRCNLSAEALETEEQILTTDAGKKAAAHPPEAEPGANKIANILALQTAIQKTLALVSDAKNRYYLLRNEALPEGGYGCHASSPIKQMAIEIDGAIIDREFLSQQDEPLPSLNASRSLGLGIDFGGFGATIDLAKTDLLGRKQVLQQDFSTRTIADLRHLIITKLGTKIDNLRECHKTILIFDSCVYASYEENLISISGVRLWVNDMLLYDKSLTKRRLDQRTPTIKLADLQQSDAWMRLMQRDDCQVQQ